MIVGFVTVNYNSSRYSAQYVKSIAAAFGTAARVVVVDNASSDIVSLRQDLGGVPGVTLIEQTANLGYFAGLNVGLEYLLKSAAMPDAVVVGNNDLEFDANFARALCESQHLLGTFPVISPDIITLDNVHQNPHVINGVSSMRSLLWEMYYLNYQLASVMQVVGRISSRWTGRRDHAKFDCGGLINQGYGACYILTPVFFSMFKELWAPTVLMGEEYFLYAQLKSVGHRVYYEPKLAVRHHCHASVGQVPSRRVWKFGKTAHRLYRMAEAQHPDIQKSIDTTRV